MTFEIEYQFKINDNQEVISLSFDGNSLEWLNPTPIELPDWALLENRQCAHCPLTESKNLYCPVAKSLAQITRKFEKISSYQDLELTIITETRTMVKETTAQTGLSSLLGLVMATSGCPYTDYLKPMARYHLPLASEDETLFRAVGMYLIGQHLRKEKGLGFDADLQGLSKIYDDLHQVNLMIAERLRDASLQDSSINAVVLLDMFTNLMPYAIDDKLEDIEAYFSAYLID
jgi:hypothetical protein